MSIKVKLKIVKRVIDNGCLFVKITDNKWKQFDKLKLQNGRILSILLY